MAHIDQDPIHETWVDSDKPLPKNFIRPVLRFTQVEAAGGFVLLLAAAVAVIWANSAFYESYFALINHHISLNLGVIHLDESVKHLINDGLMAVFFFVVGLEIKRELVVGELNSVKKASLPAMAALGGMAVPALIYVTVILVTGTDGAIHGWGVPMATDIAFSVGVVALLGSRIAVPAKLFLLALAIVDDIGAIAVIAIFYTAEIDFVMLGLGVAGLLAMWIAQRQGIWSLLFYVPVAFVVWYFFLESGVHATIAGVLPGLMTPVRSKYSDEQFRQKTVAVLDRWDSNRAKSDSEARLDEDALELAAVAKASVSPLNRLEHALHPWSSFVIVPLFALANAGVRFIGNDASFVEQIFSPVALAVAAGLLFGKPIGVTLATWIGLKLNLGELPARTTMKTIAGLGALAGIGFTVSLFVAELAFTKGIFTDEAKLGIFIGSGISGIIGFIVLRTLKTPQQVYDDAVIGLDPDPD
ncbi:MAG: Na+/H+ antiporter NhaA [Acidimicrobiia bacterium]|nr:Na+/H+ antiporter NhaA [Acidimicrobiia bacterium]